MANNVIGSLLVNLGMETGRLKSDTRKASNHFNSFERKSRRALSGVSHSIKGVIGSLGSMTGAIGLLSVAGLGVMVKSSINATDKIGKLSARLGASTEALSEYRHVAALSGVTFETLTMGWQRMTRRVAEAAQGTGEAKAAIKELGLSAVELNRLKPEQQFEILADSLKGLTSDADRVRLAMKLFDSEGVSLIQTMTQGSAGLREMRAEARDLGVSLSQLDTDQAAAANDAFARLNTSMEGMTLTLVEQLGPSLSSLADQFATNLPESIKLGKHALDEFWLLASPENASPEARLRSISEKISDITNKILAIDTMRVEKGMDGPLWPFEKQIQDYRKEIDALQAEYDRIAATIITITPAVAANKPDAPGLPQKPDQFDGKDDDIFQFGFVDDNKTREAAMRGARVTEFNAMMKFEDAKTQLVRKGERERLAFSMLTSKQQTKHVIGEAIALTQGVTGQSRKLFEINKAAGIGNALINTYEGVSKSLSKYPWPLAGAMAALHLASGMAQVDAIKSTSFGGGGGAPSLAATGGTPSNPVPQDTTEPTQEAGSSIIIQVEGNVYANDDFRRAMVDALEQAQRNDEVRIVNAN